MKAPIKENHKRNLYLNKLLIGMEQPSIKLGPANTGIHTYWREKTERPKVLVANHMY